MKGDKGKRKKVSFFGLFGQGNLGNESTLQAVLYHLRRHLPDAEVNCICTGPETAAGIHKIPAVSMHEIFFKPGLICSNPITRILQKIFMGIPSELYRWVKAFRTLKGTDMFIVPGTQFLSDNLVGPFGWPYLVFKWSVTSKIRGCKLLFVSVGVGPLRSRLSRFFVKFALYLADYRSYRDDLSREYLGRIGFSLTDDPVYPDLAFSSPVSAIPQGSHNQKPVVAVGVKNYQGQYGPRSPQYRPEDIYHQYIDQIAAFVAWLLEHRYIVRFVIGDICYDTPVLADLRKLLIERKVKYDDLQIFDEPIETLEQLIAQLATSDIVVSSRFHNVLFALLLNKPVIALSYHEKFSALMEGPKLAKYNLHIDHFDSKTLSKTFLELEGNTDELKLHMGRKVEEYRASLDKQYRFIFRNL